MFSRKDAEPAPIRHASTVILVRPSAETFEVYLVKRAKQMAFMGGAYVFPGGKLDAQDVSERTLGRLVDGAIDRCDSRLERTPGVALSKEQAAGLYVAAARELFEEVGVLLASGAPAVDESWRDKVHSNEVPFCELFERVDAKIDIGRLNYFAHWITPSVEPRRYDTRFFVTALPPGQNPTIDRGENTEAMWLTAADAITAHRRGTIFLPPPTLRTLEELDTLALGELAEPRPVAPILPKIRVEEGKITIVLPWDSEYPALDGDALAGLAEPHPRRFGSSEIPILLPPRKLSPR